MKNLFLITSALCLSYSVQAQNKQKEVDVHSVEIIANRLQVPLQENNHDIQIITSKEISQLPVQSVQEILSYVTGIDVKQRGPKGAQADISINGGTFEQTLILINGIKFIDPQTGHHNMNLPIPINSIERIEIIKGSLARKYGINAINGAINIVTKKNMNENSAELMFGLSSGLEKDTSNNELFYANHLALSTQFKINSSANILSYTRDVSNGYRYNTVFNNQKIFLNSNIRINENEKFNVLAAYTHNSFGANAFYAAPVDKESTEKVETFTTAVTYTKTINRLIIAPKFSYRYNFDDYIFIRQKPEVYRNKHFSNVYQLELDNIYTYKKSVFALGIEYRNEQLESNNLGDRNRENYGINLEHRITFFDHKLDLNTGVYFNYNSTFGYRFLPGVDAGYQLNKFIRFYGSVGTGQRVPSFTDLFYKGPANIGNQNLSPEISYSQELGLKFNYRQVKSELNVFNRQVDNFIDWTKINLIDPWQPSNFNTLSTLGMNISNTYTFKSTRNNFKFNNINLSYTWLKQNVISSNVNYSKYVIESLRDQVITQLSIKLYGQSNLLVAYRYLNRVNYKKYQVVDLRLQHQIKRFELNVDINNIFDERYEEIVAVPMMPRWWGVSVRYRI
jgi:iron complex outermembrane receptor protein